MEEGSGYAGGDGDQVALSGKDLDLAGAGELRKIHGTAGTNAGNILFVRGDGREVRQELTRVNKYVLKPIGNCFMIVGEGTRRAVPCRVGQLI